MNARKIGPWFAAALVLAGGAAVSLRMYNRHELQLVDGDRVWRLAYHVRFHAPRAGGKVRMAVPSDTPHNRLFRQDVQYSELSADRMRASRTQGREVELSTQEPGEFAVTAKFDLHVSRRARWPSAAAGTSAPEARAEWLRSTKTIQADSPVIRDTIERLRTDPDRPVDPAQRAFEFCARELDHRDESGPGDALGAIQSQAASPLGRARALTALLRASKVPARLVTGFGIKEDKERGELHPHTWVEAQVAGAWKSFDPEHGYVGEMPYEFVPVRRDGFEIIHTTGADTIEATYSLVELPAATAALTRERRLWSILDLTRLPLEMHEVLSLILLLPIGALVTAVFRTIIGIRTFGTFTPTLIALSFVFNDWKTGVCVFIAVLALGLLSRTMLDRLKLLMVPRLGVILTLVVLAIVFAVSLLDYFHSIPSTQAVLLPMVILTMTIERFYLTTEEDGPNFAMQLLAATVLVAFCCYLVLCWNTVGRMLLTYPESHLFTVAALVLIGRYTGYRLTELWRFRDLVGPRQGGG